MYDESKWVKADSSNSNETYKWYNYDSREWANVVLVTSTNKSTYQSADPGTTITESDILAYYVWIPRYKYKVWNINKVIGTDSYNAQTTGIDIVFEKGKESTGTISCNYDFSITDNSKLSETCAGSNGNYYTHPAFTFGSDELRGVWVGKFELTGSVSKLTILPSATSLTSSQTENLSTTIQNMQTSNNIYGLNASKTNTDSHMITHMEWGVITYLTNSKYGRCSNGNYVTISPNAYNRSRVGDATGEVMLSSNISWYTNNYSTFFAFYSYHEYTWLGRGGYYMNGNMFFLLMLRLMLGLDIIHLVQYLYL